MKLIIILLAATACTSALDPATLIARDRVLGAKVSVDADPERAWPAPGESATVTWLTTSPGTAPVFSWILAACPADTTEGFPICAGPVFAHSEARGAVPILKLAIPSDVVTRSVVVLGAICASGTPVIDQTTLTASCDDGSLADEVSQHVFITYGGVTNHHPRIADAPFTLAGAEWSDSEPSECDGLTEVAAGTEKLLVGVSFAAASREWFAMADDPAPWREELQLSPFATAGDMEERFTYVESDDERDVSPIALEWTAPSDVPADGLRVAFTFVVRDLRGGIDVTTRALCVK